MQNGSTARAHDRPRKTEFVLDFDRGGIPRDAGLETRLASEGGFNRPRILFYFYSAAGRLTLVCLYATNG